MTYILLFVKSERDFILGLTVDISASTTLSLEAIYSKQNFVHCQ